MSIITGDSKACAMLEVLTGINSRRTCENSSIDGQWHDLCCHNYFPIEVKHGHRDKTFYDVTYLRNVPVK